MFMRDRRWLIAASLVIMTGWVAAGAQRPQTNLPLDPPRERGTSVTPAYEGWYANPDGTFSLLIGYYNRNTKEALDIPVGPNNRVEPGGPDQGQPTHFEIGRQWGVFVIKVPKDFGTKTITWTIVANGEAQSIPFTLNKGYPITPFKELGMGNQPPVLAFSQGGAKVTGPPIGVSASFSGTVNQPVAISVWAEGSRRQRAKPSHRPAAVVDLALSRLSRSTSSAVRGTSPSTRRAFPSRSRARWLAAAATFDEPGEYLLRVQANDESGEGGFGFQCCWTNTYVKVTVTQ